MKFLQKVEHGVENTIYNVVSIVFHSDLKPVELASGIKKNMDDRAASMTRERIVVPNRFLIKISPNDYEKILEWGQKELTDELTEVAKKHAKEQRYTFLGPIQIRFEKDPKLVNGKISVSSTSRRGAVAPATATKANSENPIIKINNKEKYVLTGAVTVVGRGSSCDIVIEDTGVSRKHLEFRVTPHGVILKDLNTTNGTFVEGHRISSATLVDGNTITLGHTTIMFWTSAEPL